MDVYPYTAGSTLLHAMLPPWAQAGGVAVMLDRLRDREARERIRRQLDEASSSWENIARAEGRDGIVISSCPARPEVEGHSVSELAAEAASTSTDYVFDLILKAEGRATMIVHMMGEEDVRGCWATRAR